MKKNSNTMPHTYTQKVIIKAVEYGWDRLDLYGDKEFWKSPDFSDDMSEWGEIRFDRGDGYYNGYGLTFEAIVSNKKFWQTLGKAFNWKPQTLHRLPMPSVVSSHILSKESVVEGYIYEWHRFIDHLIAGKDPEDFFKTIIEQNI